MNTRFAIIALLTGALACGSEPTEPAASVDLASVDVTLAKLAPAATQMVRGLALDLEAAEGRIDLSLIESFLVDIDAVEIHTPGSGWIAVALGAAVPLDLRALPSEVMGDPIPLGTVEGLEPGECRVRLFLSGASIEFNEVIEVGNSLFEAFTAYTTELRFPSGDQTGLKAE
ncbi:MAG: hypothetical protein R3344_06590, partial [Acidobacteriota bacterium]|nr:hypothetical protein [Acidobacteriota bacterium]